MSIEDVLSAINEQSKSKEVRPINSALVEYLKARRAVETANPNLVAEAEKLASQVKLRAAELITLDRMWDELIRLAEGEPYKFKIL